MTHELEHLVPLVRREDPDLPLRHVHDPQQLLFLLRCDAGVLRWEDRVHLLRRRRGGDLGRRCTVVPSCRRRRTSSWRVGSRCGAVCRVLVQRRRRWAAGRVAADGRWGRVGGRPWGRVARGRGRGVRRGIGSEGGGRGGGGGRASHHSLEGEEGEEKESSGLHGGGRQEGKRSTWMTAGSTRFSMSIAWKRAYAS